MDLSNPNPLHFLNFPNKLFEFKSLKSKSKYPNHAIQAHHKGIGKKMILETFYRKRKKKQLILTDFLKKN